MSEILYQPITTTEAHRAAATPPAPDPRLVSAAQLLMEWLLEAASDPTREAVALWVDDAALEAVDDGC